MLRLQILVARRKDATTAWRRSARRNKCNRQRNPFSMLLTPTGHTLERANRLLYSTRRGLNLADQPYDDLLWDTLCQSDGTLATGRYNNISKRLCSKATFAIRKVVFPF